MGLAAENAMRMHAGTVTVKCGGYRVHAMKLP